MVRTTAEWALIGFFRGICGSDPVRILAGHDNLTTAPSGGEAETLEDICDLEPGPCRLACMARIKGPVEVEIL